jgi:hypothetical protein
VTVFLLDDPFLKNFLVLKSTLITGMSAQQKCLQDVIEGLEDVEAALVTNGNELHKVRLAMEEERAPDEAPTSASFVIPASIRKQRAAAAPEMDI